MGLLHCCPTLHAYAWSRREMELPLCWGWRAFSQEQITADDSCVWAFLLDPGPFWSWLYPNPHSRGVLELCPIQKCLSLILGFFTDRQRMCYTKGFHVKDVCHYLWCSSVSGANKSRAEELWNSLERFCLHVLSLHHSPNGTWCLLLPTWSLDHRNQSSLAVPITKAHHSQLGAQGSRELQWLSKGRE